MYQRIDSQRAYEKIVEQIEQSIRDGQLLVGSQLPGERELAEQFGVSRVVVREATRYLESRGVVEVRHGSGTYVRGLSQSLTLSLQLQEASLVELYVVRQALELVSAPRAGQYATAEQIAALRKCLEDMTVMIERGIHTDDDYWDFSVKDQEFHLLIAEASNNHPLLNLLQAMLPLFTSGRAQILRRTGGLGQFITPERLNLVHEEHANIGTAISNRDMKAAEQFMLWHLQRSMAAWGAE